MASLSRRTQLTAADWRITALEKQLKKERVESAAATAAAVAAAVEVEKAKATNVTMKMKSHVNHVSFLNRSASMEATIVEKESALSERDIQDIREEQKHWVRFVHPVFYECCFVSSSS